MLLIDPCTEYDYPLCPLDRTYWKELRKLQLRSWVQLSPGLFFYYEGITALNSAHFRELSDKNPSNRI
jgi:hypothetical protein